MEDSPAGIAAGKAAGCRVIGLLTSHTYKQIASSTPDWILQDLRLLKILRNTNGKVVIEMSIVRREA
jgi:glycerol 3-phosphatase-1